jgi:hypothetical protein
MKFLLCVKKLFHLYRFFKIFAVKIYFRRNSVLILIKKNYQLLDPTLTSRGKKIISSIDIKIIFDTILF